MPVSIENVLNKALKMMGSNCSGNNRNRQIGSHQIKKLFHIKGNNYKNQETAHRTGEKSSSVPQGIKD
jgi:hypothetical protein